MYGMILSFSSLGLGQWYMRNIATSENKQNLTDQFLQIQIQSGVGFYIVLLVISTLLYGFGIPTQLALIIGLNVVFDNIIYAIKCINIISYEQHRTFMILFCEALLKVMLGVSLFFHQMSIFQILISLVFLRVITLQLFIRFTAGEKINIRQIILKTHLIEHWRKVVTKNWPFVIIGSISVLYWSVGNILASKFLPLEQVSYYEISFKLFAMAEIIPLMLSSTIFPQLSKTKIAVNERAPEVYKICVFIMNTYGVLAYIFVYCYASYIIPTLFGIKYNHISNYTAGMFLTMLIFPMSILQANLIVANKKEKTDMWLNVISLITYLVIASIGMIKFRDLTIINYSIFISFLAFNILQGMFIHKMGWQKSTDTIINYLSIGIPILIVYYLEQYVERIFIFPFMTMCYLVIYMTSIRKGKINFSILIQSSI